MGSLRQAPHNVCLLYTSLHPGQRLQVYRRLPCVPQRTSRTCGTSRPERIVLPEQDSVPVYSVFRPDLKHQSLLTDNRVCPSNFDISDGQIRFSVKCARLGEANPFGNFQKLRELKEGRLASTVRPIPPQREEGRLRQVP